MQTQNKLFCHWDLIRFVSEKHLETEEDTFLTLSVTDGRKYELMIFLGKEECSSEYEVRVYKAEPGNKYVPDSYDNVDRYEENDKYATFFFKEFNDARRFTEMVGYAHPEYKKRPVKEFKQ